MNYNEFVPSAIRTESIISEVVIDKSMYQALITASLRLADNLDLIKKNVFYGKPIDSDRFNNNITEVSYQIQSSLQPETILENTATVPVPVTVNPRVFHGVIGIITEALELAELIDLDEEYPDKKQIGLELGDLQWYSAILCDSMSLDMEEDVLVAVITKLKTRFPDKFESALAITRNKLEEDSSVHNI